MSRARITNLRANPWQQSNWDWRAAGNFIGGGSGGGLMLFAALAAASGVAFLPLALAAVALVGGGLFCVWLEIGRPMRAFNVFRHFGSSWMTREAFVAPALFATALGAAFAHSEALTVLAGALGGLFLYCQARILVADKGIPAWRQPKSAPLMISTGLAEGAGLLTALLPLLGASVAWLPFVLLALLGIRAYAWRSYLKALRQEGAPAKALAVLDRLDGVFLFAGGAAALLVAAGGLSGWVAVSALGGIIAALAGWTFKYTLLRRAGYTQGYALPHVPVRGRGTSAPGVKPGWARQTAANDDRIQRASGH